MYVYHVNVQASPLPRFISVVSCDSSNIIYTERVTLTKFKFGTGKSKSLICVCDAHLGLNISEWRNMISLNRTGIAKIEISETTRMLWKLWGYIWCKIVESYNVQHIYFIMYSKCHCGATASLTRRLHIYPHNETHPHNKNIDFHGKGAQFLLSERNISAPRKPTQSGYGIGKPSSHTTTGELQW